MSTLADGTIAALRSNHDDLAARVCEFDERELARQSGSSEWDVAQVLGHLGSGAEIALAGLQAGLGGRDVPGRDAYQTVWDRWNAMGRQEKASGFLRQRAAGRSLREPGRRGPAGAAGQSGVPAVPG